MDTTKAISEETLDLTIEPMQKRDKKILKPFSIESIISSCYVGKIIDEKNEESKQERRESDNEEKQTDWYPDSEVICNDPEIEKFGEDDCESDKREAKIMPKVLVNLYNKEKKMERIPNLNGFFPEKNPSEKYYLEQLGLLSPELMAREKFLANKISNNFMGTNLDGLEKSGFPGNRLNPLDRLHDSVGLQVNFLDKLPGGNLPVSEQVNYNWPFIYNTWLHSAGLFLNPSVSGIVMGPQDFCGPGPGPGANPRSPLTEGSDTSLSPGGVHDLSRNSGKLPAFPF